MLAALRAATDKARADFESLVSSKHPGCDKWDWYRALDHASDNPIGRPNDDQSHDAALVADTDIENAHAAYINTLHTYYRARDGEGGFLGGRA